MKNILIWGTGKQGKIAFDKLNEYGKSYHIVTFGDNDMRKIGNVFCGKSVISSEMLYQCEKLDIILIASSAVKEIKKQLLDIVQIPIIDNVDQLIYNRIAIDITGFCNAKCRWCVTGRKNLEDNRCQLNKYMCFSAFKQLYRHLISTQIIVPSTEIMLYSWGEPLLNKDYIQIIEYLACQGQRFSVSTNASIVQKVKHIDAYKYCSAFVFSMPGFSQESYSRIHGFCFDKIKDNIKNLYDDIIKHGFIGEGSISFHVYRFNNHEIEDARKFAENLGLKFNPYYPYFNGNSMAEKFLEGRMSEDEMRQAENDLYLGHVKGILRERPEDYRCFLENIITINWDATLGLCCAADSGLADYEFGSIYDISSLSQMKQKRWQMMQSSSCQKCRSLGIDYWMAHNPSYKID